MAKKINFEKINQLALGNYESLLRQWLPDGKKSGAEYGSVNPTRNDGHAGSFSVNIYKGVWQDFATGEGGSDPISLFAYLFHGNDQGKAAKDLAEVLGVGSVEFKPVPVKKDKAPRTVYQPIVPPDDATEPPKAHPVRGLPEAVWAYRSDNGDVLGYVYRFKTSDGGKETLPLSWCRNPENGAAGWRWMAFSEPRWLYGIDRLHAKPKAPVLIVEGEKCADYAARQLPNIACISWPGGSKAVGKVDWIPLSGRDVVIWPDCDAQKDKAGVMLAENQQPGTVAANKIADVLLTLGCKVWIITIPKPGEKVSGWDIADAIDEGLVGDQLAAFIRSNALRLMPAKIDTPVMDGDAFSVIKSAGELLDRYTLIYAHKGMVFDHDRHIMLSIPDLTDACLSRDYVKSWMANPNRKIVPIENVGFDPGGKDSQVTCNLWGGWPTVPIAGHCEQILDLIRYMCGNESNESQEVLFNWLIKWMAYPIQNPGAKMKSSLVVHGPQGTGKNLVFECLMEIYGQYGRIIGQDAIEDNFNDWASKKLFLIADEVVARSDVYHVKNKLKSFITGDWIRINSKNVKAYDERNHVNMVFLSNERMPVVLEEDDRRHAVIWTPNKLSADFYRRVAAEKEAGGVAALHDYLLKVDLTGFSEHSSPPMTDAKRELIDLSKDSIIRFYEEWESGYIDDFKLIPVLSEDLFEFYRIWCGKQGAKPGALNRLVDSLLKRKFSERRRCRYLAGSSSTNNAKTFLFARGCESLPDGMSETAWLGRCVSEFRELLSNYRGRNYD